jgi:hypothetical protein
MIYQDFLNCGSDCSDNLRSRSGCVFSNLRVLETSIKKEMAHIIPSMNFYTAGLPVLVCNKLRAKLPIR